MIPSRTLVRGTAAGALLILLSLFGCARLPESQPPTDAGPVDADPASGPVYGIEIINRAGKPELRQRKPLDPQQPVFVQQALDESKVLERYDQVKVTLVRLPAPGQPPLKLDVPIAGGRVELTHDYALHPGDRLTVIALSGKGWLR